MNTSLWDLKQKLLSTIEETKDHEYIPMGFETRFLILLRSLTYIMNTSLWDLKQPIVSETLQTIKDHEYIPMGFETS